MEPVWIHRAVSPDGTEIVGHAYGQGPPLVLVHGAMADGDLEWGALLPFVGQRFTCHVLSTRNRGRSGASADLSPERLVEDVTAFADSIGEPVGLLGVSGGGMWALSAAARARAVSAVAAYEPVVFETISEDDAARLQATLDHMGEAVAKGQLAEAARMFLEPILNAEELAALSATSGYFEAAGTNATVDLEEARQAASSSGPSPTDPSVLARVTAPVLLLHGSQTTLHAWFTRGVRHVARHVADARVREVAGAGHLGPSVRPELVASELVPFFESALQVATAGR